jgi:acyl carrier protein
MSAYQISLGDEERRGGVEDTGQVIAEYIVKQFMPDKPDAALADDLQLFEQGIIDSLGIFVLIAFLEQRFAVKIAPEDVILENFDTPHSIKQLVVAKLRLSAPT